MRKSWWCWWFVGWMVGCVEVVFSQRYGVCKGKLLFKAAAGTRSTIDMMLPDIRQHCHTKHLPHTSRFSSFFPLSSFSLCCVHIYVGQRSKLRRRGKINEFRGRGTDGGGHKHEFHVLPCPHGVHGHFNPTTKKSRHGKNHEKDVQNKFGGFGWKWTRQCDGRDGRSFERGVRDQSKFKFLGQCDQCPGQTKRRRGNGEKEKEKEKSGGALPCFETVRFGAYNVYPLCMVLLTLLLLTQCYL